MVKQIGMMHLLISGNFESEDVLYKTIENVYRNFTSIYDTAAARFHCLPYPHNVLEQLTRVMARVLMPFCRCSLMRILEEDGISIKVSLANLLAEIEHWLLQFVAYYNIQDVAAHINTMKNKLNRIEEAYFEPIYCYHLIIRSDLMIEFLHHCLLDMGDAIDHSYGNEETLKKHFIYLRNFLEVLLTKDSIHCPDKLLVTVENVAYLMAHLIFLHKLHSFELEFHYHGKDNLLEFHYHGKDNLLECLDGVNKAMVLLSNDFMSDELLLEYVTQNGMMHLLISSNFESKKVLYKTIEDVYRNFTSIYDTAAARFHYLKLEEHILSSTRVMARVLITFCRCSLMRILEEDGISIKVSLANLLAEIEHWLLQFVAYYNIQNVVVLINTMKNKLVRIVEAYFEPIYCYHLIIKSDLVIEFLHHCLLDMGDAIDNLHGEKDNSYGKKKIFKYHFIYFRNFLEELLTKDSIHCPDKLLVTVENVAYQMAHLIFLHKLHSFELEFHYRGVDNRLECLDGVNKAMVLLSDDFMSDELLVEYVKYVQENLLDILQYKSINLKDTFKIQLWMLYFEISFSIHLLITYPLKHNSEHQKLSNIWLHFQALARNVGSLIISCLENPEIEERNLGLFDIIKKANVIRGEIIKTICCIVLQETEQEPLKKDQLGSLIILLKNWKEFMDRNPGSIITWKDHENLVLFIFYLIQNNIRGGDCTSSHYTIQLDVDVINHEELKQVLISAQVDAFEQCFSHIRTFSTSYRCACWKELYLGTKHFDLHMRVGILKSIWLSSTTPLTDELLFAYANFILDSLLELRYNVFDQLHDQFSILHKGLSFLVRMLICYMDELKGLSHIKVGFQDLVRSVGNVICLRFKNSVNGYTKMKQISTDLSDLVEKMNVVIVETEKLLQLVNINKIRRESPKTNQLGSFNLILKNWEGLMECKSDLIITWKDQFQKIHENLVLFESFITFSSTGDDESQKLYRSIMSAGHVAEYLLTAFSVGICPVRCTSPWFTEFIKDVELIKEAVKEATNKKSSMKKISTNRKERCQVSAQSLPVPISTDVVGFEEEMKLIEKGLYGHLKKLDVISIVGMPGLGKTTLARKAYEDRHTKGQFDVRAWCYVSQEYNEKDLLLTILGCISELTSETRELSESDLSLMVHKELHKRRYLIVLDDIWDISAFEFLRPFFPDDNMGSRIMLTSRYQIIGSQAQYHSKLIEPHALTDEQSWHLMEQKIYNKEKCPNELLQIGKEIAENCRGVPLALVVVAGIMAKSAKNIEFWKQVSREMAIYTNSESPVKATLELSFVHLPNDLKQMFIYFGAFPKENAIPTRKLLKLWMAEGFVQKTESWCLESQAEKNLMDLIDRNLVMVTNRKFDGRVNACRVHDLLRDMCLVKAKEEKFLQQIDVKGKFPVPLVYQRRLSMIERDEETSPCPFQYYQDLSKLSIIPPIYSILLFCNDKDNGLGQVIFSSKLLKVFDAGMFHTSSDILSENFMKLVHLRYLSFHASLTFIPSSISRLRDLETLFIGGFELIVVPKTIWEMTKLRHIRIKRCCKFSAASENSFILENLQTFSTFRPEAGEEEKIFRKLPALKRLSCEYEIDDSETQQFEILDFESLGKLESLKIYILPYGHNVKLRSQLKFPLTLKKLSIIGLKLEGSQISMLKELQNLEFLKLVNLSVADEVWDMEEDDVFANLKALMLSNLEIKRWSASSENFPLLRKLVLSGCRMLEEIPDLAEIYTLQKIEVKRCSSSVVKVVKEIQKEHKAFGNYSLEFDLSQNKCEW